jgi:tetratricopeptide (TPR) repeat protein
MKIFLVLLISITINKAFSQNLQMEEDVKYLLNSGFTKDSLNLYDDAIQDYTKAISINPKCPACYILRYTTQVKMENYIGAIEDLNIIIDEFNNDHKSDYLILERGRHKVQIGNYDEAIEDFNIYIDLSPKDSKAYFNRGLVKFIKEDFKGAISDMTKVIEFSPKNDAALNYRGKSKKELKDYRGAISDFSRAILLKPKMEEYYFDRIEAKSLLTDFKGVLEDCNLIIKFNPKNGRAFCGRGMAKIGLNQKEAGCADLSKSGEMGFDNAYEMIKLYCQ